MLLKGDTTQRRRCKQWQCQTQDDPSQGKSFAELEGFAAQVCRVPIKLQTYCVFKLVLPSKQLSRAKCSKHI